MAYALIEVKYILRLLYYHSRDRRDDILIITIIVQRFLTLTLINTIMTPTVTPLIIQRRSLQHKNAAFRQVPHRSYWYH